MNLTFTFVSQCQQLLYNIHRTARNRELQSAIMKAAVDTNGLKPTGYQNQNVVRTWMTFDQVVDDVGLFHRVERDEVGTERGAVFARLVPRSVEVGETVAGAPATHTDEFVGTARVTARPDASWPPAARSRTVDTAGSAADRADLERRQRLSQLSHVGADLAHVTQRSDGQLLHHLDQLGFEHLESLERNQGVLSTDAVSTRLAVPPHTTLQQLIDYFPHRFCSGFQLVSEYSLTPHSAQFVFLSALKFML